MKDGIRTAGIVIGDSVSKGPDPTLEVLSIAATTSTRQSNEILPYIPPLRKFFSPLPHSAAQMSLKVVKVPLSAIEAITDTMIKVPNGKQLWYLRIRQGRCLPKPSIQSGAKFYAEAEVIVEQLNKLCSSWTDQGWDEVDWSVRVKDMKLRDVIDNRREAISMVENSKCVDCPNFVKHVSDSR